MVAYARKQSRFAIFEWQEKEKGWYLYTSEYLVGWKKKGSVSQTAKANLPREGIILQRPILTLFPMGVAFLPLAT